MTSLQVYDCGFTVIRDPCIDLGTNAAIVDVILVHGLQGHPLRTWLYDVKPAPSTSVATLDPASGQASYSLKQRKMIHSTFSTVFSRPKKSAMEEDGPNFKSGSHPAMGTVYWPKDLLPHDCPNARIMVWGYNTIVTQGYTPANKSNIFAHAKDLLYAVERSCPKDRNIIFVAHSLGGLLVKEVLRRSQHADDPGLQRILHATQGVIFLGTPHRGSPEFAKLGDLIRMVASVVLRVDNNASILRALALDSPELELSRESFLQQWRTCGFQVKTFQESQAITGINLRILNQKVVPDTSSSLDDPRERAETLQSDHRNMTKYWGRHDPNYIKVSAELQRIIKLIPNTSDIGLALEETGESFSLGPKVPTIKDQVDLKDQEKSLNSLAFATMFDRQRSISEPLTSTCGWFRNSTEFKTWLGRQNSMVDQGLLWVKGKPGSGKSTIMKDTLRWIEKLESHDNTVASFFFNARGNSLDKTPLGLFRSILYQIFIQAPKLMGEFLELYQRRSMAANSTMDTTSGTPHVEWRTLELEEILKNVFRREIAQRIFILIDALDECEEETVREVVYLFADISRTAHNSGIRLNICFSSRHYPTIIIPNCPEIVLEEGNKADISAYVHNCLRFIPHSEAKILAEFHSWVMDNASGVFLWVVLILKLLLRDIDGGESLPVIMDRLKRVPKRMEDLYAELCCSLRLEERRFALSLTQWVLFGRDLILKDLHTTCLAARLSTHPDPATITVDTLKSWGYLGPFDFQPEARLLRLIKTASRGLIEYTSHVVQFIHESVREFFISGPGLQILNTQLRSNIFEPSYRALVIGCINALELPDSYPILRNMQCHAEGNVFAYARKVEKFGGSNIMLLDRIEASASEFSISSVRRSLLWGGGETVLHLMSRHRITSCVQACLARGDAADISGTSLIRWDAPLIAALKHSFTPPEKALVESLVEHGANLKPGGRSSSALIIAVQHDWLDLARYFLLRGADVNCTSWPENVISTLVKSIIRHRTNLARVHIFDIPKALKLIDELLSRGADINYQCREGTAAPLHQAIDACYIELVKYLVDKGADIDIEDRDGTPLSHAARLKEPEAADIIRMLVAKGAKY